jgi:hypothetical protein
MEFFKTILAVSMTASLFACGGGSGASAPSTPVVSNTQGNQVAIGTAGVFDVNYGQFTGVYTFLDNGDFYGIHFVNHGLELAGHPHGKLTANNSITKLEAISWANFIDDAAGVGQQELAPKFGRTFNQYSIDVTISGGFGQFSTSAFGQKTYAVGKNIYQDPIAMPVISGSYTGVLKTVGINMQSQVANGFVIDSTGNFTVTAVNCKFSGKLVQHGTTGIFDTQVDVSGVNCHLQSPLKGIVTPLALDNSLPTLGVQLNSADNVQTAVFIVKKS